MCRWFVDKCSALVVHNVASCLVVNNMIVPKSTEIDILLSLERFGADQTTAIGNSIFNFFEVECSFVELTRKR